MITLEANYSKKIGIRARPDLSEQFILKCLEPSDIRSVHGDLTGYRDILCRFPISLSIELASTHSLAKKRGRTLDGESAETSSSSEIS